jgi:FHIPEP family
VEPAVTNKPTELGAPDIHQQDPVGSMVAQGELRVRHIKHMPFTLAARGVPFVLMGTKVLRASLEESGFARELHKQYAEEIQRCGFSPHPLGYREMNGADGLTLLLHGCPIFHLTEAECLLYAQSVHQFMHAFRTHLSQAFDIDICVKWLESLREIYPHTIDLVIESIPTLFQVDVIRELLDDGLTLAEPRSILEAMLRAKDLGPDIGTIADLARTSLKPNLTQDLLSKNGKLHAVMMDDQSEERFRSMTKGRKENAVFIVRDPGFSSMLQQLKAFKMQAEEQGTQLAVITKSDLRRALGAMIRTARIDVPALGISEIGSLIEITKMGILRAVTSEGKSETPPPTRRPLLH